MGGRLLLLLDGARLRASHWGYGPDIAWAGFPGERRWWEARPFGPFFFDNFFLKFFEFFYFLFLENTNQNRKQNPETPPPPPLLPGICRVAMLAGSFCGAPSMAPGGAMFVWPIGWCEAQW